MKWIKKVATTPLDTIAKVIDTLTTQTNERTNAPSIRAVNEGLANKWQDIYPIGSIYMSVNNIDPSTVFGGTWQPIKDCFLLAAGDTYNNGATGGSATIDPNSFIWAHDHAIQNTRVSGSKILKYVNGNISNGVILDAAESSALGEIPLISENGGAIVTRAAGNDTESGESNMPPYLVVNVWVRTA